MNKITLKAEKRKVKGRKVSTLRRAGILPANVYGKKIKSEEVQVNLKEFNKVYAEAGETGLVELTLGKDTKSVLIHDVQLNPLSDEPIHADFLQVDLTQKVTATVPVEIQGESPAEKSGIGTVVQQLNEIEVEALPADLPEKFVVDATKLEEVDQVVKVADLNYDKAKVELKAGPEEIVAKVEPPQKEEVIIPPPAPAAEGEAIPTEAGAQVPTEGGEAAPTAGEEKPQE